MARCSWEEAKEQCDSFRHEDEVTKLIQVELREIWHRIHRIRVKEFKTLGLHQESKKRNRRAAKKGRKETGTVTGQKARSSTEIRSEREDRQTAKGGPTSYAEVQPKVELKASGDPDPQSGKKGRPTDRPPDKPPPWKGASRGSLQERAGSRHASQLS
jgi:hypothetical protein